MYIPTSVWRIRTIAKFHRMFLIKSYFSKLLNIVIYNYIFHSINSEKRKAKSEERRAKSEKRNAKTIVASCWLSHIRIEISSVVFTYRFRCDVDKLFTIKFDESMKTFESTLISYYDRNNNHYLYNFLNTLKNR